MTGTGGHTLNSCLLGCGAQDEVEDGTEVYVLCCKKRCPNPFLFECKEHYCIECINTHNCRTNVLCKYNTNDGWRLNSLILLYYATCFVAKV